MFPFKRRAVHLTSRILATHGPMYVYCWFVGVCYGLLGSVWVRWVRLGLEGSIEVFWVFFLGPSGLLVSVNVRWGLLGPLGSVGSVG